MIVLSKFARFNPSQTFDSYRIVPPTEGARSSEVSAASAFRLFCIFRKTSLKQLTQRPKTYLRLDQSVKTLIEDTLYYHPFRSSGNLRRYG